MFHLTNYKNTHGVVISFTMLSYLLFPPHSCCRNLKCMLSHYREFFYWRFLSISIQVGHRAKVEHWGSLVDCQQIGAFRPLVDCLGYVVDAMFAHRFQRPPSSKRCDNSCNRITPDPSSIIVRFDDSLISKPDIKSTLSGSEAMPWAAHEAFTITLCKVFTRPASIMLLTFVLS